MTPRARRIILALLVLLSLAVYAGVPGNRFTNWDDEHLIVKNTMIRSLDPLRLLRSFHLSYPPLTVFTHCLDYFFWGLNPAGYHLTDLLLYALIVAAFFLLAERITGDTRAAFAAAALFAVHPLHVESVAWLSSRKDGVAMLCYMAAFLAYARGGAGKAGAPPSAPLPRTGGGDVEKQPGVGENRFAWLSALLYLGAVWAKPLMVTLPLALLLHETICRRESVRRALGRLLPFAVPLALTAFAAVFLDPHNEVRLPWHGGSPAATARVVLRVMGDYLRMLVLPVRLNALYLVVIPPRFLDARCLLPLAACALIAAAAVRKARSAPLFAFCAGWAAVSLLPVMQLIPSNVIKADRYLYLPTAAICLLCGAWWADAARRGRAGRPWRLAWFAGLVAVVALFSALTVARCAVWRDSVSLWESSAAQNPSNPDALNNLGIAYARERRYGDAAATLSRALSLRPAFPSARNNLANVYLLTGRYDDALRELKGAAGLERDIVYAANASITMGMAWEGKGEYGKALEAYEKASRLVPAYLDDSTLKARIAGCKARLGEGE